MTAVINVSIKERQQSNDPFYQAQEACVSSFSLPVFHMPNPNDSHHSQSLISLHSRQSILQIDITAIISLTDLNINKVIGLLYEQQSYYSVARNEANVVVAIID